MHKLNYLLIFLLLCGCNFTNNCNKMPMPLVVKSWAEEYKIGDQYVMKSNLGNLDTITLFTKTIEYTPCNRFELGPNQYEQLDYSFLSSNLKNEKYGATAILYRTGFSEFGDDKMIVRAFDMYWVSGDVETDKLITRQYIKVEGIKDTITTYLFNKGNYFGRDYNVYLESFNWSKKYGLVRYTVKETNETFEYFKRI